MSITVPTDRQFEIARRFAASRHVTVDLGDVRAVLAWLFAEVERLMQWVNDLQTGMYINCVYCGHRYGPESKVQASMADVLKEHIERCPLHPMSALKQALLSAPEPKHCDASGVRPKFIICDADYADWYSTHVKPLKADK